MTPEALKSARIRLGMTQAQLAKALRLAPRSGADTVRKWENGSRSITGPVSLAVEYLLHLHLQAQS